MGNVRDEDLAQRGSPVTLDQEALMKQAQTWTQEEEQFLQSEDTRRVEGGNSKARETLDQNGEGQQARGQRKRVRPSWLKEFVRLEGRWAMHSIFPNSIL